MVQGAGWHEHLSGQHEHGDMAQCGDEHLDEQCGGADSAHEQRHCGIHAEQTKVKHETMKTTCVGVLGTWGSLTVARYNEVMGAIGVTATTVFVVWRLVDYAIAKIKKHRKPRD